MKHLIEEKSIPLEYQKGLNIVKTDLAKANQGRQLTDSEIFAQEYVINNYPIARENFINESKKEFGVTNIVSADIGKFAIPGMEAIKSIDYHEAGSALSKARTQELLADPLTKDLDVLFMAGGSGAGKSRSLREIGADLDSFAMVHDSNLDNFDSAVKKIEQALASRRKVQIMYVYRDPIVAYKQGVIPRIKKQSRIVPIKQHAKTHLGARTNIERLIGKYGNKVEFTIIDNTGRKGETKVSFIDKIPKIDYTLSEIEDTLYGVSKNALQRHEITIEAFQTILKGTPRLQAQWESEWWKPGRRKITYGVSEISPRNWPDHRRLETKSPTIKHLSSPEITASISKKPSILKDIDLNKFELWEWGTRLKIVEKGIDPFRQVSATKHLTDEEYKQIKPYLTGVDEPRVLPKTMHLTMEKHLA